MKRLLAICLTVALLLSGLTLQIFADEAESVNTYNGEVIPFEKWNNIGMDSSWAEENGVITADGGGEWQLLQYDQKISGNYIIEFDVKQPDKNKNLQIIMGFECEHGENYTTTGLTLELHNAGVGRLYDTAINRQNQSAYGGCNNSYGGHVPYSASLEWIHVKIMRVENLFLIEFGDGTQYFEITATLDNYNGGYLVLGAQNARQVSYKNITIQDNLDIQLGVDEPTYPEDPGTLTYNFNGNKYGEWITDGDAWTVDGAYLTQTATDNVEHVAYMDTDKIRNFRLSLDYEVLSETEGYFGIGFRKSGGAKPYQETLGYSLLFKCTPDGNTLTVIDYLEAGDSGLDGLGHDFELAGHVEISCSGNEICVWLDDELIVNVANNSYASGLISLFSKGCSVEFSNMEVLSDALVSTESAGIVASAEKLAEGDAQGAAAALAKYEALNAFQKSLFPDAVKTKLETMAKASTNNGTQQAGQNSQTVVWIIVGVVAAAAVAVVAVLMARKKKHNQK